MDKHCEFISKEGKRCRAYKITDSKYCFTHSDDPEIVAMREEALRKAAESHKLYLPISTESKEVTLKLPRFINLNTTKGIKKAYITIIRAAAVGSIDERRLGALTYALNGYVNALDKIQSLKKEEGISSAQSSPQITEEKLQRMRALLEKLTELHRKFQSGYSPSGEVV